MDLNRFIEDENEEHYFGFSSTEFCYNLELTIKNSIQCFMDEFRNALLEEKFETAAVEEEVSKLKEIYMRKTMDVLEKFKGKIRDIFQIPPNAQIYEEPEPEDNLQMSEEEIAKLRDEIVQLEKTYFAEKLEYDTLLLEKEIIDKVKNIEQHLLNYEPERNEKLDILSAKHVSYTKNTTIEVEEFI